jgi:hypothetical protein
MRNCEIRIIIIIRVINTEAEVLNIDNNSTISTQTLVSACNEYFSLCFSKICPQ